MVDRKSLRSNKRTNSASSAGGSKDVNPASSSQQGNSQPPPAKLGRSTSSSSSTGTRTTRSASGSKQRGNTPQAPSDAPPSSVPNNTAKEMQGNGQPVGPGKNTANQGQPNEDSQPRTNGINAGDVVEDDVEMEEVEEEEETVTAPTKNTLPKKMPPVEETMAVDAEETPPVTQDEMEVDSKAGDDKGKTSEDPTARLVEEIKANFSLLERAVTNFDPRYTLRVLRNVAPLRRKLNAEALQRIVNDTYPAEHPAIATLTAAIASTATGMEVDAADVPSSQGTNTPASSTSGNPTVRPEVDVYVHHLVQVHLHDTKRYQHGCSFSSALVQKCHSYNRRTLDSLAARCYFYYCRFHELINTAPNNTSLISVRPHLFTALRTATLRKDTDTQATILVLLLRNFLATNHVTAADQIISKSVFPMEAASSNLAARYMYYLGRIRAIQLEYSAAHEQLQSAIRKAPQSPVAAGFIQAVTKLDLVVQLLLGDIPARNLFLQPMLERPLQPYLQLISAVRVGELDAFFSVLEKHTPTFKADGTYTLILRLRQSVIRTGLRTMSLMYSRISLRDICLRLKLDSEESAEYIVAKAIRDGFIEARLDHEAGVMQSGDVKDVYSTVIPGEAFHARIGFCMSLHNESVKAMRFPMNQHRMELKNAQEARERERELAKEIQDGDIDEDDAGGEFEGL